MKKTIGEERRVEIVSEQLLDDNTLLQIRREDQENPGRLKAVVKYIDINISGKPVIKEDTICYVGDGYLTRLEFNDKAIAVFSRFSKDSENLVSLYVLDRHQFVPGEKFIKYFYEKKFEKKLELK